VITLLRQPLGPFVLAVAGGLGAAFIGTSSGSVLAFCVTVVVTSLLVAALDLMANLSAEWHSTQGQGVQLEVEPGPSLVGTAWELLTAHLVVIAVVGGLVSGVILALPYLP
jgi:hypothetical protein